MNVVKTKELPEMGVSHNPDIKKKVFIGKGEIPNLMMFGEATFKPGQSVDTHSHDTMFEVFHIQTGKVVFAVNDERVEVSAGDCITIEPGEKHRQSNESDQEVTWLYFGIATKA
ncbi:MAG: cupin domain-containing protein [Candidatus Moranbacteria bacterium]|nr:cupin domain-containing protein [Candidatus Moranbacteria bacterium]